MRSILVMGLMLAAVIVLIRVIMGTPFIKSIRSSVEGFQDSSSAAILAFSACPMGSTMYMYDGTAYCCSGIVNTDGDLVQQTCIRPFAQKGVEPVFCTLGPGQPGIPNCSEVMNDMVHRAEEGVCPSVMPHGVYTHNGGKLSGSCCADQPTGMMCPAGSASCKIVDNEFQDANNCRFMRERETQTCPSGFNSATIQGQGPLSGLTLYGCSDQNQMCYSQAMVARLGELGYDASALTVCGSN
jgi:hypothetical protein